MSFIYRYLRHSDEVAKQPNSRQAQLNTINAFLAVAKESDQQLAAAEVFPEEFWDADVSGDKEFHRRHAGGALLARMQRGDVIISAAWDRMFRNCRDAENTMYRCDKEGVRLIGLDMHVDTATGMGRFAARIVLAKGELEFTQCSERIKDRTKVLEYNRGIKIAKGLPIGWMHKRQHEQKKKNGEEYAIYVPNSEERNICRRIVQLRDDKKMSFSGIATLLNNNGSFNKRAKTTSKKWTYESVQTHYQAAKSHFPCKDYDKVTGQNTEQLMVPVVVENP